MQKNYINRRIYSELSLNKNASPSFLFSDLTKSKGGFIHKKDIENALPNENNGTIRNFFNDIDKVN